MNGKEVTNNNDLFKILDLCKEGDKLESTDAAPEVLHPRPTRDAASDAVACASDRVCVFFFFFFLDSSRLGSIRAVAAQFASNRLRFAPNWADSAISGRIGRRPIRPK